MHLLQYCSCPPQVGNHSILDWSAHGIVQEGFRTFLWFAVDWAALVQRFQQFRAIPLSFWSWFVYTPCVSTRLACSVQSSEALLSFGVSHSLWYTSALCVINFMIAQFDNVCQLDQKILLVSVCISQKCMFLWKLVVFRCALHLYKRVCLSVSLLLYWSVGPLVHWSHS